MKKFKIPRKVLGEDLSGRKKRETKKKKEEIDSY